MVIDFTKVFDTDEWPILLKVLHLFKFNGVFIQWVRVILRSARLFMLVNSKVVGYFGCSRGFVKAILYLLFFL